MPLSPVDVDALFAGRSRPPQSARAAGVVDVDSLFAGRAAEPRLDPDRPDPRWLIDLYGGACAECGAERSILHPSKAEAIARLAKRVCSRCFMARLAPPVVSSLHPIQLSLFGDQKG